MQPVNCELSKLRDQVLTNVEAWERPGLPLPNDLSMLHITPLHLRKKADSPLPGPGAIAIGSVRHQGRLGEHMTAHCGQRALVSPRAPRLSL
jgi:hypothetical protein